MYKVLRYAILSELEIAVNEHLKNGFVLCGGIAIVASDKYESCYPFRYLQAMVKK